MIYRSTKRAFDFIVALFLFALSCPIMFIAALAIWRSMGRPVLFTQIRPGKSERPFRLYKFRSMSDARAPTGEPLPDSARLTKLGRLLRRTSVDELPQLINVLRGEMSLVGPRPLLQAYLPYYTERERLRHSVPPGITGLAQVRGRNGLSWEDRLAFDVEYAERASWSLDISILVGTVKRVLSAKDVDAPASHPGPLHKYRENQVEN